MKSFQKYMKEEDDKPVVSFDFDNTIAMSYWDNENNDYVRDVDGSAFQTPNEEIVNKIKEYKSKGYRVIVVTSRYDKWREDTESQLKEWGIPIDKVYFTNGAWKANGLKQLGVEVHYDDDWEELRRLKYKGIKGIKVRNENLPSDKQL